VARADIGSPIDQAPIDNEIYGISGKGINFSGSGMGDVAGLLNASMGNATTTVPMLKLHFTIFVVSALSLIQVQAQTSAVDPVTPEQPVPIEPPVEDTLPLSDAAPVDPFPTDLGDVPADASVNAGGTADLSALSNSMVGATTDFQGDDVASVLRLLARKANANIVVSDMVAQSGQTVTMRLQDKSPIEAMRIIVTAKNLIMDEVDGVFYVKTQQERAAEPTEIAYFTFSYAKAQDAQQMLRKQLQSGLEPQVDKRTNSVFYREHKSNLENIRLFLETIDKPTRQVMIEARLVEVSANPKQAYGINWSGTFGSTSLDVTGQPFTFGSSTPINPGAFGAAPHDFFGLPENGNPFSGTVRALTGQLAILSAPQVSATLRLINEDEDAEFIANPRVVTADNETAEIKVTRNQPVPQLNFNEQTATAVFGGWEDKEFGNTLNVTPSINKDDFITMEVKPEISNKVRDAEFAFAGAIVTSPIIDKRALNAKVVIKSGDTLAIGGLLQDESGRTRTKVPVLGDIPLLGYLFQERVNRREKRNLLVFVTPTIIKSGYGTGLEDQVTGLHHSGEEYADPNGWRNNAKGAIRLVPTSHRQLAADYPVPGAPLPPSGGIRRVNYKTSAYGRER